MYFEICIYKKTILINSRDLNNVWTYGSEIDLIMEKYAVSLSNLCNTFVKSPLVWKVRYHDCPLEQKQITHGYIPSYDTFKLKRYFEFSNHYRLWSPFVLWWINKKSKKCFELIRITLKNECYIRLTPHIELRWGKQYKYFQSNKRN